MTGEGVCDRCADSTLLDVGARGTHGGRSFTLAGYAHAMSFAGGHWNEWLARFDDGTVAWLVEANGTLRMLFEREGLVPAIEAAVAGEVFVPRWVTAERGEATRIFTRGDPGAAAPGQIYGYVDLSAAGGLAATVEADGHAFVGATATLSSLGLAPRVVAPRWIPAGAAAGEGLEPILAPGFEARLDGVKMRVVGVVERSAASAEGDDERHVWQEHLLYHTHIGFTWLVVSDGHWTHVRAVDPGEVEVRSTGVVYEGAIHRALGDDRVRVDRAIGEFPWDVAIGSEVDTAEFARPPHVLARESASGSAAGHAYDEVSWSIGTYLAREAIRAAVGSIALPRSRGRAPHQPRTR